MEHKSLAHPTPLGKGILADSQHNLSKGKRSR